MRPRPFTLLFVVAAAAGLFFTGFATFDFVEHLDRQVHGIHCSFIPGLAAPDVSGSSGCHVTLMSPYSSVFRAALWGGLPISLPGMAVFAFLLFRGLDLWFNRREDERGATLFLAAAAVLPVLTSLVLGYISLVELDATCKLCVGTYVSSFAALAGALGAWRSAGVPRLGEELGLVGEVMPEEQGSGMAGHLLSFGQGVGFVAVPTLLYLVSAPDFSGYAGRCGSLTKPEDPYGVMVALDENEGAREAIEVFDPLCPSCRAFEKRLASSGLDKRLHRKALIFPLDNTCNWMVDSALHPGACVIAQAVLCAEGKSDAVIDWAFANQEAIRSASQTDQAAAARMVTAQFPELRGCIGSPGVESKINKSLRWAVSNQIPVLTPQLYVDGTKLCDEDTDLGMDFALSKLLDWHPSKTEATP
jgi:uncharacterized membrane protein